TLNYEMFFYALFAIAMLFGSIRVVALLAALLLVSVLALAVNGGRLDVFGRFYSNDIIFEFGFGVLLQLAVGKWEFSRWSRLIYLMLMLLGFTALCLGFENDPGAIFHG